MSEIGNEIDLVELRKVYYAARISFSLIESREWIIQSCTVCN